MRCVFQTFDSCWLMYVGDWGSRCSRSFSLPIVSSWIMFAGGIMLITVKQHQSVGHVWIPARFYMLSWAGSSGLPNALIINGLNVQYRTRLTTFHQFVQCIVETQSARDELTSLESVSSSRLTDLTVKLWFSQSEAAKGGVQIALIPILILKGIFFSWVDWRLSPLFLSPHSSINCKSKNNRINGQCYCLFLFLEWIMQLIRLKGLKT